MDFSYSEKFLKELKKLTKKYPSLEGDIENFKRYVPFVDFDNNKKFVTLAHNKVKKIRVLKTRLMVRSLKGSNKTRLIFAFFIRYNSIEFIEIYIKNNKAREDVTRLEKYLDQI